MLSHLCSEGEISNGMAQSNATGPSNVAEASQARRVLVVDPHATLRTVLAQRLRQDGHLAAAVATAREALEICQDQSPDLLVSAEQIGRAHV